MSGISEVHGRRKLNSGVQPEISRRPAEEAGQMQRSGPGVSKKDRIDFSEEWGSQDLEMLVKKTLEGLREQYPSLNIVVSGEGRPDSTQELAVSLGKGAHLVLSKEFLKRMCCNEKEFITCRRVLAGMAERLAGETGKWASSGVIIREADAQYWSVKKKTDQNSQYSAGILSQTNTNESKKRKPSVSCNLQVSKYYREIASARSKNQVRTVMGDIYRATADLRIAAALGEGKSQKKARLALRSLQKLLIRGRNKIGRMEKEELAARRERKARERLEKRKAEQARQELRRRRAGRAGFEHGLVKEGMAEEAYIRGYRQYRRLKGISDAVLTPAEFLSGLSSAGAAGAITGADFSAADVSVSQGITF